MTKIIKEVLLEGLHILLGLRNSTHSSGDNVHEAANLILLFLLLTGFVE